ncbi:acyl-CoA-binding domain-containing protein 3-like [Corylus avellana]|uniref:acyl-CoA-binding domain-containing protein 3-like n=1 Tax=Corylus avellana TaxID=13451 RepID=UPI00286A835D|nr:acyl-CoA-binding domain-containing protein 3-like [Corylus avellana]
MELVQEFFVTASLALFLSFLVAKLVSMAMATDAGRPNASEGMIVMEDLQFGERLTVQGLESETKVQELVEEEAPGKVNEFRGEPVLQDGEIVGLPEKSPGENVEDSVAVKESSENRVGVESAADDEFVALEDPVIPVAVKESLENRLGVELAIENEVVGQSEEIIGAVVSEVEERNEEKEVGLDSDEDDWEGIERSELEKDFAAAANFVLESPGDTEGRLAMAGVGNDVQMDLYGLHKIATEGPCHEPQPMALKLSARAKWNAWQRLGQMSPEVAMDQYIKLLSERVPGWMEDKLAGDVKPESLETGISSTDAPDLTTFSHQPSYIDERKPDTKTVAEEGDEMGGSNFEDRAKE